MYMGGTLRSNPGPSKPTCVPDNTTDSINQMIKDSE